MTAIESSYWAYLSEDEHLRSEYFQEISTLVTALQSTVYQTSWRVQRNHSDENWHWKIKEAAADKVVRRRDCGNRLRSRFEWMIFLNTAAPEGGIRNIRLRIDSGATCNVLLKAIVCWRTSHARTSTRSTLGVYSSKAIQQIGKATIRATQTKPKTTRLTA